MTGAIPALTRSEEAMMILTVEIRRNYGTQAVYPTCQVGETFARIAGTKTLTDQTRALMKQIGYTFIPRNEVQL